MSTQPRKLTAEDMTAAVGMYVNTTHPTCFLGWINRFDLPDFHRLTAILQRELGNDNAYQDGDVYCEHFLKTVTPARMAEAWNTAMDELQLVPQEA